MGRSGPRRAFSRGLTVALTIALVTSQAPARLFTPIAAVAPPEAAAAPGFTADFAGQSANVVAAPGASVSFVAFFTNTGTTTWMQGTPTQVNLAVCVGGTCGVESPQAAWNAGWLSPTAYARQTQSSVSPGQIAQFVWNVTVPSGTAPGEYLFEGELENGGLAFTQSGYTHVVRVPQGQTYVVNTTADDTVCTVTACSLRGAITAANANPGADTIVFQIPGGAPSVAINVTSELPAITESVVIDASIQDPLRPAVQINGTGTPAGTRGLVVQASSVVVRGLILTGFPGSGILALTGGAGRFVGNWIGLDAAGTAAAGNGTGIELRSANNIVGGTTPRDRNVISGNNGLGVYIVGTGASGNIVRGNYIGTNTAGSAAVRNGKSGIQVQIAGGTVIGGTAAGAGNVISGNGTSANDHDGVLLTGTGTGATIQGNRIGTNATGTAAMANAGRGIKIDPGASGIVIGGTAAGARNVISGNGHDGIAVSTNNNVIQGNYIGTDAAGTGAIGNGNAGVAFYIPAAPASNNTVGGTTAGAGNVIANNSFGVYAFGGTGNAIRGNSIYNNHQLGIDLAPQGVNLNDAGDGDGGTNNGQNYPVITAIATSGSDTTISWGLNSVAGVAYALDFFQNASCNQGPASFAYGEGQTLLATFTVTTDASGNEGGVLTVPALPAGTVVTATATDPGGNTSEFSACASVPAPALPDLVVTAVTAPASVQPGGTISYSWTVKNQGSATANAVTTSPPGPPFVWGDQAWISTSPTSIAGAYPAGGIVALNSLAPGASYDQSFSSSVGSIPPGNYYFIIETDSNAQIGESIETNNLSIGLPITVSAAPFIVNTVDDLTDGTCNATHCSLREAITAANASPGADQIHFAIAGSGPHTIAVTGSPLPAIAEPVSLDGLTQPGAAVGAPKIVLSGSGLSAGVGLAVTGGGSEIRGLAIARFPHAGVHLLTNGGNRVVGNLIGLDAGGAAAGNLEGVVIESPNNVIGGATAGDRNVISGNSGRGVLVLSGAGNVISGNYIGTNAAGLLPQPNGGSGVLIEGASGVRIGGTLSGERNVLSGNGVNGVKIRGAGSTGNLIQGNYIGIGADGASDIANQVAGIDIQTALNTVRGNVISGNNVVAPASHGIVLQTVGATDNVIAGNLIGPRADGTRGFPNHGSGVYITSGASNNTIGGTTPTDRNVISGNSKHGVHIATSDATGNVIRGNYIGLASDGQTALGNGLSGVAINGSGTTAAGNTVRDNVISSNGEHGLKIELAAAPHVLLANVIGLAADGLTARPNTSVGLYVYLGETPQPAAMDISLNTVSGNAVHGLYLYGLGGATVASNRIGLATDGTTRGNGADGIVLLNTSGLVVKSNQVFGNGTGVVLGAGNVLNVFSGNTVRGNGTTGFVLNGATNSRNTISAGSISGHSGKGISLLGGANAGIVAPVVTSVSTGDGLSIAGTGAAGNTVAIYADPADEGLEFLGIVVVSAGGTWQKSGGWVNPDTSAIEAALRARTRVITATQTDGNGNTSEFSSGIGVPAPSGLSGTAQCNSQVQPGATVELLSGSTVVATTTAGPDGRYAFSNVAPNTTYSVRYTAAGGLTPCGGQTITADGTGSGGVPPPDAFQDPGNTNWINAFPLASSASHPITAAGQSRWYKKSVQPGQQIRVFLENVANVGVNLQIALYDDLVQVAQRLQAEATTASLQATPFDNIPFDNIPFDNIPFDNIPLSTVPFDNIPFDNIPFDNIPFDNIPFDNIPFDNIGVAPTSYTAAQRAGLLAVSARPGLSNELIVGNVGDRSGDFYVQVWADNGALPPALKFFTITAVTVGGCTVPGTDTLATLVRPQPGWASALQIASTPRVLILWNPARTRMDDGTLITALGNATPLAALQARLNQLASESGGVVVDLDAISGLQQFYAQWDQLPTCVAAANIVTDAIRDVIVAFRTPNPSALRYEVLVGGDPAVPYRRSKDRSGFSTERNFNPPVLDSTFSRASLVQDFVLEQDFYASFRHLQLLGDVLALPDIAIGRLAETTEDISAALDAYFAAPLDTNTGDRVVTPSAPRALVTGYSFLSDFATALADRFQGYGLTTDRLIQPANLPPTDPSAWSAADVSNRLFATGPSPTRYSVVGLIAHFSASEALAADYKSVLRSAQVLGVTDDRFLNTLILSPGCHSGYNVLNPHAVPGVTETRDWTQAWTRRGATAITQTGYAYGDTEVIGATEELLIEVARELGFDTAPVPIGRALRNAKRTYFDRQVELTGLHKKVLEESTLYGVPMLSWNFTSGRTSRPAAASEATPSAADTNGLSTADLTPAATINRVDRTLTVTGTTTTATQSYFTANGDVQTIPFRPILPRRAANVAAAGRLARGAVLLSAGYVDIPGFAPLVDVIATEIPLPHSNFVTSVFWPPRPFALNPLSQTLVTTPAQYLSDGLSPTGTARVLATQPAQPAPNVIGAQDTTFRVYYSNRSDVVASMAGPPAILRTAVTAVGTKVKVEVTVAGAAAASLEDVLVTYTGRSTSPQNTLYGRWRSCSLVPGRTNPPGTSGRTASCADAVETTVSSTETAFVKRFSATVVDTANTGAGVTDVLLFIQAVNIFAEVAFEANDGNYYRFVPQVATAQQPKTPITLTLQAPATATYGSEIQLNATLTGAPAGSIVTFGFGNTQLRRATGPNNDASVQIGVNEAPGSYSVSVAFDEDELRLGSAATATTVVQRAATTYEQIGTVQYSDAARVLLLRSGARTVNEQVNFIQRANGTTFARLSDGAGGILLDTLGDNLGAGTITVRYDGDDHYFGTERTFTIAAFTTAEDASVVYTGDTVIPVGSVLNVAATVTQAADGAPGDLALAQARFDVKDALGVVVASVTAPVSATGQVSATIAPLAAGVYTMQVTVVGGFFAGTTTTLLVVFDPSTSTAGGGWVLTTSTSIGLPLGRKATFGFHVKYKAGTTIPEGELHLNVHDGRDDGDVDRLRFAATSFDWLAISGTTVGFEGSGTINKAGTFRFRVTATDPSEKGNTDTFEVRIWDAADPTKSFDSPNHAVAGTLGGGNIRIRQ